MGRTIYRLEGCLLCELVVDRLESLCLGYNSVWVEGRHSNREEVKRVSGQRVVPVLVDERYSVTMTESGRILEFLDTAHAGASEEQPVITD